MRISDWSSDVCSSDVARLEGPCARGVIAAERRAADGDPLGIDVLAGLEIVDAVADRNLVIEPRRNAVPSQGSALPRAVDHQDGDPAQIGRASCRERVWQYV